MEIYALTTASPFTFANCEPALKTNAFDQPKAQF